MSEFLIPAQIAAVAAGTTAFWVVVRAFGRALRLRPTRNTPVEGSDTAERLARIEQLVETTAIEIERIGEANRFLAKLLAERVPVQVPRMDRPERVNTPH